MNEQAPAGWYPDGSGNDRYWDGAAWTEHMRPAGPPEPDVVQTSSMKQESAFSRLGTSLKKAAADKQASREERDRRQAEYAQAAGTLVTSGVFGTATIEIYSGGYVRIASGQQNAQQPARITRKTPYEKLRSIKMTAPAQTQGSSTSSPLDGAVGPAVAGLMKGGRALIKGSAPGLAAAGIAHLATAEGRTSFLMIATDQAIHNLTNQSHNGFVNKVNRAHVDVGLALEAAAVSVLDMVSAQADKPSVDERVEAHPALEGDHRAFATPTLTERLRELAALHQEGILSDDEYAAAKGTLLRSL